MDINTNTLNRQLPTLSDKFIIIRSKIKKIKVKCAQVFSAKLSAYIEYNSKIENNLISDNYYFVLIY